jgi:hypothetical protein
MPIDIITVIHLDVRKLDSFDIEKFKTSLYALGYRGEPFLNDFGFCPHIICAMTPEKELFVDNTNSGNYASHTRLNYVIDCPDVQTFFAEVQKLTGKKPLSQPVNNTGTLF